MEVASAEINSQAVLRSLERLNSAVYSRNMDAALALFTTSPEPVLVGAEAGEVARGTEQLRAFFERLFSRPVQYCFRWDERTVEVCGDVAWLFANGVVISTSEAGLHEHPYRISVVLVRHGSEWLWAHYHASEPAG